MKSRSRLNSSLIVDPVRLRVRAFVALMGCLLASGCAGGTASPSGGVGDDPTSFADQVKVAIEQAEAGGASDDQLSILREAQDEGVLTFEQAHSAALATLDCYIEGGGSGRYYENVEDSGLVVPMYMALAKDDATLTRLEPLMDACGTREGFWVNKLYQLQPVSQETRDAYLRKQGPVIRACLEDHGYATDPSATPEELVQQAMKVDFDTNGATNCY